MSKADLPPWWPVCGHCGAPVERFSWTADSAAKMTLRVECHGAAETTVWARHEAVNALATQPFSKKD